MKIFFNSLSRPKRAAKALSDLVPRFQLSKAQEAVAYICGYDSWDHLRATSEDAATVASADDEALSDSELEARLSFQVERAREYFGITTTQAENMVKAIAPGGRTRTAEAPELVVGTNVYMPPLNACFAPDYPFIYEILPDVATVELDFVQPRADDPAMTHLVSEMRVTFLSGESVSIEGIYLWKFLDLVPPPFSDANGDYLQANPFTSETTEQLALRLRIAYASMIQKQPFEKLVGDPPLQIKLNLPRGRVTTVKAPGLEETTRKEVDDYLNKIAQERVPSMQASLDNLMRGYLKEGYTAMERKFVGQGMLGLEYVPRAWAGKEALPFKEFLKEYSAKQRHESGCGGNLTFRELLTNDLRAQEPVHEIVASWFVRMKKENSALFQRVCADLGLSTRVSGKTVAELLLTTKEALILEWHVAAPVIDAQNGKVLSDWEVKLSTRKPPAVPQKPRYGIPKVNGGTNA